MTSDELSTPPALSFFKRMMECTSPGGEEIEVSYDGNSERIFQISAGLEPPPHYKVAKTHDHLHVDDMTDDEIAETWYTTEDIKKFRKQKAKDKKVARRLRKQRIQQERQHREDDMSSSDASSVSTAETADDSSKRVTWGMVERNPVSSTTPEETIVFTKPALRADGDYDEEEPTINSRASTSNGVQYRALKSVQRDLFEQDRIDGIYDKLFVAGLVHRGETNRFERYGNSLQSTSSSGDDNFLEEEKRQDDTQPSTPETTSEITMVSTEDIEESKNEEEQPPNNELDEIFDLLETYSTDVEEEEGDVDKDATLEEEKEGALMKEKEIDVDEPAEDAIALAHQEEEELFEEPEDCQAESFVVPDSPVNVPDDEMVGPEDEDVIFMADHTESFASFETEDAEETFPTEVPTDTVAFPQPKYVKSIPLTTTRAPALAVPASFAYPTYPAPYNAASESGDYFEVRLEEVFEDKQRSPELVKLAKEYQDFRRKLHNLVKSVKKYHESVKLMEQARSLCLQECSTLIEEPTTETIQPGSFQYAVEKSPIIKLKELAEEQQNSRDAEFQESVLDYAMKWEECVTQKVDRELKEVKKLQQNRLHYEKKVDSMRKKVNGLDNKGKEISPELVEKLERNESKLKDAWETHELRASRLCALIEQVTHAGWKDLYPLVGNLMKYEFNRSGGELAMYGKFPLMLNAFERCFQEEAKESEF